MNKALLFDLDGTLVLTEKYHSEAFRHSLAPLGIEYTYENHLARYSGRGNQEILEMILTENGKPLSLLPGLSAAKKAEYNRLVEENGIPTVQGAKKFLALAKSASPALKLAIASSTTKQNAALALEKTGIKDFFELIVTREDVKETKPCPDIFLFTAKKLGVEPNEAVVFEDSPRGIEAAERGGFASVGLATLVPAEKLEEAGADLIIENFVRLKLENVLLLKNKLMVDGKPSTIN